MRSSFRGAHKSWKSDPIMMKTTILQTRAISYDALNVGLGDIGNKKVEDSAKFTFNELVVYVGVKEWKSKVPMEGLNQACVVWSCEKFLLLFAMLKKMILLSKELMIFFSTRNNVKNLKLLRRLKFSCYVIHGNSKWHQRTKAISSFSSANQNLLLCTDVGNHLDIPYVDFIIQYDPPTDPKEYIRLLQVPKGQVEAKKFLTVLSEQELIINLSMLRMCL